MLAVLLITTLLVTYASAIPESDLEKFRASGRFIVKFDAYTNQTQYQMIKAFHNESSTFYVVFRANIGDAVPYDDFYINYWCQGDALFTEFHTTDYPSWVQSGIISFSKQYAFQTTEYYNNATVDMSSSICWINSATGLFVDGNAGYTNFNMELVPVLNTFVITIEMFCSDSARTDLIGLLSAGLSSVFANNVNFLYTMWLVVQILAIIFIVIGVPVLIIMLIRWAIWRISGFKILEKKTNV
jgi:hypothetical protein